MSAGGWSLAAYQAADGEYMVRARSALPEPAERARLPVAVMVRWGWGPIASEAEEDAVIDEMVAWENAAHAAAEAGGWGMLIAVVTNGMGREWLWYAANADEFRGELRGVAEEPRLEMRAYDDPNWKAARELNPRAAMH